MESLSQMPVPSGITRLPKTLPMVCVALTTFPSRSATTKCVVCSCRLEELAGVLNVVGGAYGVAREGFILAACSAQYSSESSRSSGVVCSSGSAEYLRRAQYACFVTSANVCRYAALL